MKGQRFLLLKNYSDLSENTATQLNILLKANLPVFQAHAMKEQLRLFWDLPSAVEGGKFLLNWIKDARLTGIPPLVKLAKTLEKHLYGLLNYFKHRITNRNLKYFKLRLYHLHAQRHSLAG